MNTIYSFKLNSNNILNYILVQLYQGCNNILFDMRVIIDNKKTRNGITLLAEEIF